jgi:CrcB protein
MNLQMFLSAWPSLAQILAVAVGGCVGSLARFLVGHFFAAWFGSSFPWGTLFVNVVGSTWLGWFMTLALGKPGAIDPVVRLLLSTGFAGGFTTFSSLSFETLALYQQGGLKAAAINLGLNLVLGFGGAIVGILLARMA